MENKEFLQSSEWRKFQEATMKRTFHLDLSHPNTLPRGEWDFEFWMNVIEHKLPIVGKYFYVPRWPEARITNYEVGIKKIIELARENKIGWIRIDPENQRILDLIKNNLDHEIKKAPHDMQPKELFVIDILKSEEELLSEMKAKTRYNIKLAEKKDVKVVVSREEKYVEEFLRLVKATAKRKKINFHPEDYYRKMIEMIGENILKLYCAEYNGPASTREDDSSTRGGKVIAANLVVFYNKTAIYLHGATDDEYRNVMAPYLLQWQAIKDAKNAGCEKYDFGGVKMGDSNSWGGITKFKLGFSENTKPIEFPGSYDIVISPLRYWVYRILQKIK